MNPWCIIGAVIIAAGAFLFGYREGRSDKRMEDQDAEAARDRDGA